MFRDWTLEQKVIGLLAAFPAGILGGLLGALM